MAKRTHIQKPATAALTPKRFNAEIGTLLPEVVLTIGGEDRLLRYDLESVALVEKLTGMNLFTAVTLDASSTTIRALLYAALLPEYPKLTLEQVAAWIRPGNVNVIHQAILTAWFESKKPAQPERSEGESTAQPAPAPAQG